MIDLDKDSVNFESTSGNLGRSLKMMRQDNRIGPKQIIVITEDDDLKLTKKTESLVNFFKNELNFKDEHIFKISESDIKVIENILNQSQIFKTFSIKVASKIKEFARRTY